MKVEDAFQILLGYYEDACPTQDGNAYSTSSDMMTINQQENFYHKRARYESNDIDKNGPLHVDFSENNNPSKQNGRQLRGLETYSDSKKNENVQNQYDLFIKLYGILGGDDWFDNFGWNDEAIPICEWHGLYCLEDCVEEEYMVSLFWIILIYTLY
jgi:hypothetical protein